MTIKYRRGSNQHKRRYTFKTYLTVSVLIISLISAFIVRNNNPKVYAVPEVPVQPTVTPTPTSTFRFTVLPSNTPTPTTTQNPTKPEIVAYIMEVFGEYGDKAILLLTGDPNNSKCPRGENHELDPNATNNNETWGGKGIDRGIFQINDEWNGITHDGKAEQFLYDYKINILMAWRIFEDNGYNFTRWTCGRALGI